jgi:hypothetical protein
MMMFSIIYIYIPIFPPHPRTGLVSRWTFDACSELDASDDPLAALEVRERIHAIVYPKGDPALRDAPDVPAGCHLTIPPMVRALFYYVIPPGFDSVCLCRQVPHTLLG